MKKFKFVYSRFAKVFMFLAIFLAIIGLYFSVVRAADFSALSVWSGMSTILMLLLCALIIVFMTAAFIKTYYAITDNYVMARYGFITTKVKYDDIEELVFIRNSGKLFIYYSNTSLLNISIPSENFDEFTDALKEKLPSLKYRIEYDEDKKDDKKDNKKEDKK